MLVVLRTPLSVVRVGKGASWQPVAGVSNCLHREYVMTNPLALCRGVLPLRRHHCLIHGKYVESEMELAQLPIDGTSLPWQNTLESLHGVIAKLVAYCLASTLALMERNTSDTTPSDASRKMFWATSHRSRRIGSVTGEDLYKLYVETEPH